MLSDRDGFAKFTMKGLDESAKSQWQFRQLNAAYRKVPSDSHIDQITTRFLTMKYTAQYVIKDICERVMLLILLYRGSESMRPFCTAIARGVYKISCNPIKRTAEVTPPLTFLVGHCMTSLRASKSQMARMVIMSALPKVRNRKRSFRW